MQKLDAAKMKKLREGKPLTQQAAAERAGMSVSRWNDIESGGRTNVRIETLARIAESLDVDAGELLTPRSQPRASRRSR